VNCHQLNHSKIRARSFSRATGRVHTKVLLICTTSCWTQQNRQVLVAQPTTSRNSSSQQHSDEQADILTNLEAAQKHLDFVNTGFLHALDALPASVTKDLENNPPPAQPTSSVPISQTPTKNPDPDAKSAPKVVRKKRVPKSVIPGVTPPPDPERWLKKSERSTAHQVGKRRKVGGGGGGATQGSAVEVSSPAPGPSGKTGGPRAKRKK
jgi:signal recognition particle subunit SRP72